MWGKTDVDIFNNPKVISSGPHGALAYLAALLMRYARDRNDGILPPSESTPEALHGRLSAMRVTVAQVARGMEAAIAHGLMARLPDGCLRIIGATKTKWQPVKDGRARTADWRQRQRHADAPKAGPGGDPPMGFGNHSARGSVTPRDGAARHGPSPPASRGDASVTAGDARQRHNVTDCDDLRVQREEGEYVHVPTTSLTSTGTSHARGTTGVVVVSNGEQEQLLGRMAAEGMISVEARLRAVETLREFEKPTEALDIAIGHARRHGRDVGALLASITADPDSLRAVLAQRSNEARFAAQARQVDQLTADAPLYGEQPRPVSGPRTTTDNPGQSTEPAARPWHVPRKTMRPEREPTQQERLIDLKRRFAERAAREGGAP